MDELLHRRGPKSKMEELRIEIFESECIGVLVHKVLVV